MGLKITWKTILAAVVGCVVIGVVVFDVVFGEKDRKEKEQDSINIDCTPTSSSKRKRKTTLNLRGHPVRSLAFKLATLEAKNRLDLKAFREELKRKRGELNLVVWVRTAEARGAWLDGLTKVLQYVSLIALILLLGPIWVFLKLPEDLDRRAMALGSIPFFVVTTAAVLAVANGLASIVVGVQKIQLTLAAFGTPKAAVADAVMHYVIYTNDREFLELVALLARARDTLRDHPILMVGVLDFLWRGLQTIQESAVFIWTRRGLELVARLMDLYGPIIGIAAMILVYQVVVPVVRNLVGYPIRVLEESESAGMWPFIKDQFRVLWREFKTSFWMFFFVLVFTLVAVVLVRLLTYPMVVVCIKTILAIKTLLMGGADVPVVGTVLSMLSVAIFFILVAGMSLVPIGIILSKAYFVVRTRIYRKRKYRQFKAFWTMVRQVLLRVTGLTTLLAAILTGLYFGLMLIVEDPGVRVWLPAPLFAPVLGIALWRLGVFRCLVAQIRVDPLDIDEGTGTAADEPA